MRAWSGERREGSRFVRLRGLAVMGALAAGALGAAPADAAFLAEEVRPNIRCLSYPVAFGSKLMFIGDETNLEYGCELWISDGTAVGTGMVKDIRTGAEASRPGDSEYVTFGVAVVGDNVFFPATGDQGGRELWRSDGTAAGTVQVKDITPGQASTSFGWLRSFKGQLYFPASVPPPTVGNSQRSLWRSDGTEAGTVKVVDLDFGAGYPLLPSGSHLFFTSGSQLWASDGTAAGTKELRDFGNVGLDGRDNLTDLNGTVFFRAEAAGAGDELWKSNGTAAGTVRVADIRPGPDSSVPHQLTAAGPTLFFAANDAAHGEELWKSDGTSAGTTLVKDVHTGTQPSQITNMTAVGNRVFFQADDGTGEALWVSDGTPEGTILLRRGAAHELGNVGGTLFFADNDIGGGLFASDGTPAGTVPVKDAAGAQVPRAFDPVDVNGTAYFTTGPSDQAFGLSSADLWKVTRIPDDPFAHLPPNDLVFQCDTRRIAIQFLERGRNTASLDGLAASSLIGQTVEILVKGEVVAQTVVGPDGSFAASIALPRSEKKVRGVRVIARSGGEVSRNVKLTRRARISEATSVGGRTTLEGEVLTGKVKKPPKLTVRRRVACEGKTQWQKVARGKQKRDGSFKVSFDNPRGTIGSIFDVKTKYAKGNASKATHPTATWAVALGLG